MSVDFFLIAQMISALDEAFGDDQPDEAHNMTRALVFLFSISILNSAMLV